MAKPNSVANVSILVRDYDEALSFYTENLGFEVVEDIAVSSETRWVRIAPKGRKELNKIMSESGCCIVLQKATSEEEKNAIGKQVGNSVGFFLFTENFERDQKAMVKKGVHFLESPRYELYGTVAVFKDLYGNKWDLIEPKSGNDTILPNTAVLHTYDVFASKQFQGNQLAVFTECNRLDDSQMQLLAKEMNYAESVFVFRTNTPGRFKYRIFTCNQELPFAGHPTLGTAYHIFNNMMLPSDTAVMGEDNLELECQAGIIPVHREEKDNKQVLWMQQNSPTFQDEIPEDEIAALLNCSKSEIGDFAQVVSTGTPFAVLDLRSLRALQSLSLPNTGLLQLFCKKYNVVGLYCVAYEGRDDTHTISARCFVDEPAVPEDPATGSACGCFAGWVARYGKLPFLAESSTERATFVVGQGHEVSRPSLLHVKLSRGVAEGVVSDISVQVGGSVKSVVLGATVRIDP